MNNNTHQKLKVGLVKDSYPYVSCDKEKGGFIIDIWDHVVSKYNLKYDLECIDSSNYDDMILQLAQGKYDVLLGDFSVLHRRWEIVNFSRPFYVVKVIIARKSKNSIKDIFTNKTIILLFSLSLVLIIIYAIISKIITKDSFGKAFYEAFVNFFANIREIFPRYKSKYFSKANIKILNVIWTVLRYLFYTIVISQIIGIFVNYSDFISENEFNSIQEVLVLKGTSFVDYVKQMGKKPIEIENRELIVDRLRNSNKTEYWLQDTFLLYDYLDKYAADMKMSTMNRPLIYDEISIAVNKNFPEVLDMINDVLTELQENGKMNKICRGYFDKEEDILGCSI